MRVLIINTSERIGGAAVAASRLMESLKNNGIKAKMLVRDKQTNQISVVRLELQLADSMEIYVGTYRHLESQPFPKKQSFCSRYSQYRNGYHHSARVYTGRYHPFTLDQPGNALTERHTPDIGIGQTGGMDHARHVAFYRPSATTPVNAPTISKNAITASFYTPEAARKICPPGYSTKKRRFTNKLPLHLSLVAIGWKKGQKAAPCYATRPS